MKKLLILSLALLTGVLQLVANTLSDTEKDDGVEHLIKMARNGEPEAYVSLAECYKEGRGVQKSIVNSMFMYFLYSEAEHTDFNEYVGQLDVNNPFVIVTNILDKHCSIDYIMQKTELLRDKQPGDARMLDAMFIATTQEVPDMALVEGILKEAEDMGSEMASMMLAILYLNTDSDKCMDYLDGISTKYPAMYNVLGKMALEKFKTNGDKTMLRKSAVCFVNADACGALIPKNAERLLLMNKTYGSDIFECSKSEKHRFEKLANSDK